MEQLDDTDDHIFLDVEAQQFWDTSTALTQAEIYLILVQLYQDYDLELEDFGLIRDPNETVYRILIKGGFYFVFDLEANPRRLVVYRIRRWEPPSEPLTF